MAAPPLPLSQPLMMPTQEAAKQKKKAIINAMLDDEDEETYRLIDGIWADMRISEDTPIESYPQFFDDIQFAPKSGFADIPNLWNPASAGGCSMGVRLFYATLLMVFVVYNMYFLLKTDLVLSWPTCKESEERFLLSRSIVKSLVGLYADIDFSSTFMCNGGILAGYLELLGLLVLVIRVSRNMIIAACPRLVIGAEHHSVVERKRWFAHVRLFLDDLPQLSAYSGMRLLENIQPSVLTLGINYIMYTLDPKKRKMAWVKFICFKILALVIGFDMFLTKYRAVQKYTDDVSVSFSNFLTCFLFIKQVLGIISLDILMRSRLFTFIFGGEDATIAPDEEALAVVWQALITRQIWNELITKKKQNAMKGKAWLNYLIVMMSFSDYDLQKLVLEPKSKDQ